ncbi:hypothetical protein O3P69_019741 [Scylla paramamosain]|uniref:Unconventional prefoldin RPB5 interactor n=1 Tax=Scylla paramamosain TaxID=85552 RepID=A0AAW0SZ10_SCYPA
MRVVWAFSREESGKGDSSFSLYQAAPRITREPRVRKVSSHQLIAPAGGLRPRPKSQDNPVVFSENLANLLELKRVHQERLEKVEDELSKLQKYKKDYEHLLKRLKTLPDKITHEVMVPLGTLAVVPGQLIHTNEVLVLLGDNWFAERSAKQAIHIVRRRIKDCEDKIRSCEETQRIHLGWLKEAEEVLQGEQGDQVEIIEEMTEEEYQRSQEEHRRRVKAQYTQLTESSTCHPASPPSPPSPPAYVEGLGEGGKRSYEDLMRRLDQLEVEELGEGMEPLEEEDEEEEEEEEEDDEEEEEEDEDEAFSTGTANDANTEKAVTFKPRLRLHSAEAGGCVEEDRAPTDDTDDESSSHGSEKPLFLRKHRLKRRVSWADDARPLYTIIPDDSSADIHHIAYTSGSTAPSTLPLGVDGAVGPAAAVKEAAEYEGDIKSPSDIFKVFGQPFSQSFDDKDAVLSSSPPIKSILKKSMSLPADAPYQMWRGGRGGRGGPPPPPSPPPKRSLSFKPAFSYRVLERKGAAAAAATTTTTTASTTSATKISKVSRL